MERYEQAWLDSGRESLNIDIKIIVDRLHELAASVERHRDKIYRADHSLAMHAYRVQNIIHDIQWTTVNLSLDNVALKAAELDVAEAIVKVGGTL